MNDTAEFQQMLKWYNKVGYARHSFGKPYVGDATLVYSGRFDAYEALFCDTRTSSAGGVHYLTIGFTPNWSAAWGTLYTLSADYLAGIFQIQSDEIGWVSTERWIERVFRADMKINALKRAGLIQESTPTVIITEYDKWRRKHGRFGGCD